MSLAGFATIERQTAHLQRQLHEIRQADESSKLAPKSPVELARDLGLVLDDWQERALTTETKDTLLLTTRQGGKTTVASIAGLHEAVYVPGSLTLIVTPSERQSKRLLRSIRKLYQHVRAIAPPVSEAMLSLELRNGSEIHALPSEESTIRGFSAVDLLLLDEGARIEDELYAAVRPMLAVSNGRLLGMSTAFGKRGWFWEEWDHGTGWHREKITAHDIPRINKEWLARERDRIGAWMFEQEYECEFKETDDQLFSFESIDSMLTNDFAPFFGVAA